VVALALAGAVAGALAIGVSELFAGVVAGAPSLVVAVGTLVISLQPPGAKEAVVDLFGTNDKAILNALVVVAAVAIAAAAGILAGRRIRYGWAIFIGFGLFALAAALAEPLVQPGLAVVTVTVAVVVGVVALTGLVRLAPPARPSASPPSAARPSAPEPSSRAAEMPEWDRRRFLIASAGTLAGAVVLGGVGRLLVDAQHPGGVVSTSRLPEPLRSVAPIAADQSLPVSGITPLVVPSDDFYRIDTALLVPRVDVATWQLDLAGMVDQPFSLTYDELLAMPLFEQYVTIACVSNRVGGNLVGNALWTGVRLKDLLARAGVQAGATQIVGRSVDGFTVGFPTAWATAPEREPMVAVGMNRELLPADHGYPARLIVPGLYGYVSATKWLRSIELTTREAVDGYWVPLGWAKDAPILTQSRIDTPAGGSKVAAGPVQVGGVAWAPDRGIARVEVRFDDGAWQEATISQPISDATWVQWLASWVAAPGRHSIEVRATDRTGEIQTDQQTAPPPDGARGHHRVFVTAG
jgi:DMSO/TMAO reductase YedYZ molybdopterin-dependent catalytic subunit